MLLCRLSVEGEFLNIFMAACCFTQYNPTIQISRLQDRKGTVTVPRAPGKVDFKGHGFKS